MVTWRFGIWSWRGASIHAVPRSLATFAALAAHSVLRLDTRTSGISGQGSCSLFRTRCTHAAAYRDDRLSIGGWSHRSVKDNLSEQQPGIPTIDRHRRNHSIFSTTTTTTITTTNTNAALETRSIWWKTVFYSRHWFALAVLPSIGRSTNYNWESRFCAAFRTSDANDDGTTNKFIKRCSFSRSFLILLYINIFHILFQILSNNES